MGKRERKPPVRDTRTPRQKVVDYLVRHRKATAEDIASGTRLRMTQVTPRLSDLLESGHLLVVVTEDRRNRAGNPVRTYTYQEEPIARPERKRCPTCGHVVRQSQALEAGHAVPEA